MCASFPVAPLSGSGGFGPVSRRLRETPGSRLCPCPAPQQPRALAWGPAPGWGACGRCAPGRRQGPGRLGCLWWQGMGAQEGMGGCSTGDGCSAGDGCSGAGAGGFHPAACDPIMQMSQSRGERRRASRNK